MPKKKPTTPKPVLSSSYSIVTPNYIVLTEHTTRDRLLLPTNSFIVRKPQKPGQNTVIMIIGDAREFSVDESFEAIQKTLEEGIETPVYGGLAKKNALPL